MLNKIMCRHPIPNFTHIGPDMWKVRTNSSTPLRNMKPTTRTLARQSLEYPTNGLVSYYVIEGREDMFSSQDIFASLRKERLIAAR
jgi:hypothetical protein